ncbi:hypothetical protein SCAR479_03684 [Seiridium cardinale]|uniref:Uncharacterized protein n=1 Tax=Seiridium cardinale TaxID=138064 RepID=A0ABR2Y0L9_9PEZI
MLMFKALAAAVLATMVMANPMPAEPLGLSLRDSTAEDALYDPTENELDGLTDEEKYLSSNATALAEAEERGVCYVRAFSGEDCAASNGKRGPIHIYNDQQGCKGCVHTDDRHSFVISKSCGGGAMSVFSGSNCGFPYSCIGGDRSYKHAQGERTCRDVNTGMNWKSMAFSISN